jgi:hypothetical protein
VVPDLAGEGEEGGFGCGHGRCVSFWEGSLRRREEEELTLWCRLGDVGSESSSSFSASSIWAERVR